MQESLFQTDQNVNENYEHIPLEGGGLLYFQNWLPPKQADLYFSRLQREVAWQQSLIRIAGKAVKIPRLNAWYGDDCAHYKYSGKSFRPLPWSRTLATLKTRINRQTLIDGLSANCNSALVNLYRDGNDSVAWHADDEVELGSKPMITSLSLGASRRFLLKRRDGNQKYRIELQHGSLLIMLSPLQSHWVHCVPKSKQCLSERINVTFRRVTVQ